MEGTPRFADVVTTEAELRAVLGVPVPRALGKEIARLDDHCRAFISRSPFVLVSSCDGAGRMDVSPKGDPPGFVQVLDDLTLAVPERPGNRRADTFLNVLQNPGIGLLFVIPGRPETLRVSGRASIVGDRRLCEPMAVHGKVPELALVVTVEQVFFHCAKCMLRSHLWDPQHWPDLSALPSHARCLLDHGRLTATLAEVEAALEHNYKAQLY